MCWHKLKAWLKTHVFYRKLEINILTVFLVLLISSFVFILSYTYEKNKEMMIDYTNGLMKQFSKEVSHMLNSLLIDISELSEVEKTKISTLGDADTTRRFLSNFMKYHKVGTNQKSILFTKDGTILASSEALPADKISNINSKPLGNAAYQFFLKERKNNFLLDFDGLQYVVSITPFASETNQEIYLFIALSSNVLLKNIRDIQKQIYFIFFFIVIINIIFTLIFSKYISKPIVALSHEIDRLQRLDLKERISTGSRVKEIRNMTQSVIALQSALRFFSAYVPKELVRLLLSKGRDISLGGKKQQLTILFTDIRDFTTISENMPIEDLIRQLEEYFENCLKIILRHKGTIDKYIGDAIMAFWGAPETIKNHAYLAAETALLLQKTVNELNKKWAKQGKPIFYTRMGLHTGNVIVGNIGTAERMNYTIMGDAVNLTSRLEDISKRYKIAITISEHLAKRIDKEFLVRPLDIVNVKGKHEKVKIFELVAKRNDETTTKEMVQFCSSFKEAFEAFEQKKLLKALTLFQAIYALYPDDLPTQLYIERLIPLNSG